MTPEILTITPAACLQCGLCLQLCPVSAVTVDGEVFSIGPGCLGCRDCLESCPAGAIVIKDLA
ncbi:MAG: 4Fe-4S binding protein [Candidatus Adiutrix sp.]|nr:4Fe-4S binding protein [Candidatus Adiutrix sp.]